MAVDNTFGNLGLEFIFSEPFQLLFGCQVIEHDKTGVMPTAFVMGANIAQTNNYLHVA